MHSRSRPLGHIHKADMPRKLIDMLPELENTMAQQGRDMQPQYTCKPISCINGVYKVFSPEGRVLAKLPRWKAVALVDELNVKLATESTGE